MSDDGQGLSRLDSDKRSDEPHGPAAAEQDRGRQVTQGARATTMLASDFGVGDPEEGTPPPSPLASAGDEYQEKSSAAELFSRFILLNPSESDDADEAGRGRPRQQGPLPMAVKAEEKDDDGASHVHGKGLKQTLVHSVSMLRQGHGHSSAEVATVGHSPVTFIGTPSTPHSPMRLKSEADAQLVQVPQQQSEYSRKGARENQETLNVYIESLQRKLALQRFRLHSVEHQLLQPAINANSALPIEEISDHIATAQLPESMPSSSRAATGSVSSQSKRHAGSKVSTSSSNMGSAPANSPRVSTPPLSAPKAVAKEAVLDKGLALLDEADVEATDDSDSECSWDKATASLEETAWEYDRADIFYRLKWLRLKIIEAEAQLQECDQVIEGLSSPAVIPTTGAFTSVGSSSNPLYTQGTVSSPHTSSQATPGQPSSHGGPSIAQSKGAPGFSSLPAAHTQRHPNSLYSAHPTQSPFRASTTRGGGTQQSLRSVMREQQLANAIHPPLDITQKYRCHRAIPYIRDHNRPLIHFNGSHAQEPGKHGGTSSNTGTTATTSTQSQPSSTSSATSSSLSATPISSATVAPALSIAEIIRERGNPARAKTVPDVSMEGVRAFAACTDRFFHPMLSFICDAPHHILRHVDRVRKKLIKNKPHLASADLTPLAKLQAPQVVSVMDSAQSTNSALAENGSGKAGPYTHSAHHGAHPSSSLRGSTSGSGGKHGLARVSASPSRKRASRSSSLSSMNDPFSQSPTASTTGTPEPSPPGSPNPRKRAKGGGVTKSRSTSRSSMSQTGSVPSTALSAANSASRSNSPARSTSVSKSKGKSKGTSTSASTSKGRSATPTKTKKTKKRSSSSS